VFERARGAVESGLSFSARPLRDLRRLSDEQELGSLEMPDVDSNAHETAAGIADSVSQVAAPDAA